MTSGSAITQPPLQALAGIAVENVVQLSQQPPSPNRLSLRQKDLSFESYHAYLLSCKPKFDKSELESWRSNKMPFNVASIKDKASHVKNASVTKFQDTRDKYSSAPMAKTKFVDDGISPASKPPPPPPPPSRVLSSSVRSHSSSHHDDIPAPPPVLRSSKSKPSFSPASHSDIVREDADGEIYRIDWANLSLEDKEEFFSWLDEFFTQYLGFQVGPENQVEVQRPLKPTPIGQSSFNKHPNLPPPPIKTWSKPTLQR